MRAERKISIKRKPFQEDIQRKCSSMREGLTVLLLWLITAVTTGECLHLYKERCPLLCQCADDPLTMSVNVSCMGANLTEIPKLPTNTVLFDTIFPRTNVHSIQNFAFSYLPQLRTIKLGSRSQWTLGDKAFNGIQNLTSLTIYALFESVPKLTVNIFNGLGSLKTIYLNSIPVGISEGSPLCPLTNLEEMLLVNSSLNHLAFDPCFQKLRKLKILTIRFHSITKIGKADLANLRFSPLTNISIQEGHLKLIEDASFHLFPQLQFTNLKINKLQDLPSRLFHLNCSRDFDLILKGNYLRNIPCNILLSIKRFRSINIQHNHHMAANLCPNMSHVQKLTDLNMLDNGLMSLDDAFFGQFSHLGLENLRLSAVKISKGAFAALISLKRLELENYLTADMIENALFNVSKTNITYFKIFQTKANPTATMFRGLRGTQVKTLILNHCNINSIEKGTFFGLKYLQYLDLSNNDILELPSGVFKGLSSLKELNLDNNRLRRLPQLRSKWALSTTIEKLSVNNNELKDPFYANTFGGLSNLSFLSLSNSKLMRFEVLFLNGTSLRDIDLSNNKISRSSATFCTYAPNLRELDLFNTKIKLDVETHFNPFEGCHNLEKLSLANNQITTTYSYTTQMFSNLRKLANLSLASCKMGKLPNGMFSKTGNLEALNLRDNDIVDWHPDLFRACSKLVTLSLAKNQIVQLQEDFFKYLPSLKSLELTLNPIRCDCALVDFRGWILDHHIYLRGIGKGHSMVCASPDKWQGRHFIDFDMGPSECINYTALQLSVSVSAVFVIMVCVVIGIHHYRFHIVYGYHFVKSRHRRMREETDNTEYKYDAFVAYCSENMQWIVNSLVPELENERGFSLCLHHRDWLAGPSIIDNILKSIEESRKTILVVSVEFAKSYWCQVETSLSQTRLMEGQRNSLVIVMLEKVSAKNMSGSLRHLLTSQTYLPWPRNDYKAEQMFWKSLARALKKPKRTGNVVS